MVNKKPNLELGFALFIFMIIKQVSNKPKLKLKLGFAMLMFIMQFIWLSTNQAGGQCL